MNYSKNRILVSIISDQTIPNVILMKQLSGMFKYQLFITTSEMERKGKSVCMEKALCFDPGIIPRILVDESNLDKIKEKLVRGLIKLNFPSDAEFVVNLTGGTKIMSLAAYEHFVKSNKNKVIYVPIGKSHYEELFPESSTFPVPITSPLTLKEYLAASGITVDYKKNEPIISQDQLQKIFAFFKGVEYDINKFTEGLTGSKKNYYTGGWFEDYLYYKLKNDIGLQPRQVYLGAKLLFADKLHPDGNNDNEADIIFTLNNELYIIEAKASLTKFESKLENALYKLSAINKNFGLRSHPYIVTLADVKQSEKSWKNIKRKADIQGISILDRNELSNPNFSFKEIINHKK